WWLGNALLVEADSFAWALPLAVFGLPAFLAFFYGLATLVAYILWSDGMGRLAALALGFGLAEWLRSFVATGFPWNAIGYGVMPMPVMMQSAGVVGLFGVTALAVFVLSVPALLGTRRGLRSGLAIGLILSCAHLGFGAYRLSQASANTRADCRTERAAGERPAAQAGKDGQGDDCRRASVLVRAAPGKGSGPSGYHRVAGDIGAVHPDGNPGCAAAYRRSPG